MLIPVAITLDKWYGFFFSWCHYSSFNFLFCFIKIVFSHHFDIRSDLNASLGALHRSFSQLQTKSLRASRVTQEKHANAQAHAWDALNEHELRSNSSVFRNCSNRRTVVWWHRQRWETKITKKSSCLRKKTAIRWVIITVHCRAVVVMLIFLAGVRTTACERIDIGFAMLSQSLFLRSFFFYCDLSRRLHMGGRNEKRYYCAYILMLKQFVDANRDVIFSLKESEEQKAIRSLNF